VLLLLIVCLVAGLASPLRADELLRLAPPTTPTNQTLRLMADNVATWQQAGQQVVAMQGNLLVDQGTTQFRATRGIAWIDLNTARTQRLTRVTLYVEGDVRLEQGTKQQVAPAVLVQLATYGDLAVKSKQGQPQQQSLADTEFYQQAVKIAIPASEPKSEVVPAAFAQLPTPAVPTSNPSNTMDLPRVEPRPLPDEVAPMGPSLLPVPTRTANAPPTAQPVQQPPPLDPIPSAPPPAGNPIPQMPQGPPVVLPTEIPPIGVQQLPIPEEARSRIIDYAPRFASSPYQLKFLTLPSGEQAAVVTGGIILTVKFPKGEIIDLETDRLVAWTRGANTQALFTGGSSTVGGPEDKRQIEFFLSGNVEIRYAPAARADAQGGDTKKPAEFKVLRAEKAYYDVTRNRAIAINGELEIKQPALTDTAYVKAEEIWQLSPEEFQATEADIFSSKLPSNPGLKLHLNKTTIIEREVPRRSPLGLPIVSLTGTPAADTEIERIFTGRDVFVEVADVPIFYWPYLSGNVNDPLGPLQGVGFRQDQVYGTQLLATFDFFKLIGVEVPSNQRGRVFFDYLSERGPATGGLYNYFGNTMFGEPTVYNGSIRAYGIYDQGFDQLGGAREKEFVPSAFRGRVQARHIQDWQKFQYQGQVAYLSDHNFLESYYKAEYDMEQNSETFGNLKYQDESLALSLLVQGNIGRTWVNETQWFPRGDAQWLGVSFFDLFTYNARANAGYADTVVPNIPPNAPQLNTTDTQIGTTRLNLNQELSLPIQAGPVKVVPYGLVDLAYYSHDLQQEERGRFYGGGGVRASLPLSRLYPGVCSELFNLNGLNHKIVFGTNYFIAGTDVAASELPQLDRLNDDATDQAARDIRPEQVNLLGNSVGTFLQTSPIFNPQLYAIRRLVDNRTDTLDQIQVVQADIRQRWQTKRGFPGAEHIIDYISLDVSASLFPDSVRDNFGETVSFLEYQGAWNVGDRTTLLTSGWFDPFENGARYYSFGGQFSRPDNTQFFLGYRQIDPIESKAVTGAVTYIFSTKYMVTAQATYDFGVQKAQTNSLIFSRVGTDVRFNLGFNYDALIQNFGVTFELIPNILANSIRGGGLGSLLNSSPR